MLALFWSSVLIIFYTFIGYGLLLYALIKIKRVFAARKKLIAADVSLPTLTIIIAAYNEQDIIEHKVRNTLGLRYPSGLIQYIFVTDGSTDKTAELVAQFPQVRLLHSNERKGKINAIHRTMAVVDTEIVVFTDANTFLNDDALLLIARHYADAAVGAVAGEKRVEITESSDATAGEGFYWKYESLLKKWDSELYSVVGAAGELFSIKSSLYQPVPLDSIIDDFMISMLILQKNYRIVYEPGAFATEKASANTKEELKRKIRIAAGGIQSILRLKSLLNPFKHPAIVFQYISHRVLRWTITPFALITALLANIILVFNTDQKFYWWSLIAQLLFYTASLIGYIFEKREVKMKVFFIPYYFVLMNYAVIAGIRRYIRGSQSAIWEKAARK